MLICYHPYYGTYIVLTVFLTGFYFPTPIWVPDSCNQYLFIYMFILFTEIPVFPTVTAKVAFEDFQWRTDFDTNFFKVPKDYREDASRWVLLLSYSHNKYLIIIMYIFCFLPAAWTVMGATPMQTKWIKLDPLIMVVISSIKSTHFGLLFCCYFQVVLHFGDPSFCLLFTLLCTGISYFAAMMIANNQRRAKILKSLYVWKNWRGTVVIFSNSWYS